MPLAAHSDMAVPMAGNWSTPVVNMSYQKRSFAPSCLSVGHLHFNGSKSAVDEFPSFGDKIPSCSRVLLGLFGLVNLLIDGYRI